MANLKEIVETLNSSRVESDKFKADPVGYLESKGLVLPDEAKKQLVDQVKAQTANHPVWNVGIFAGSKS